MDHRPGHVAQRVSGARQQFHFAVQGHLAGGRDRSAGADLLCTQDQHRDVPRGGDLAGRQPDVCHRLLPDRRRAAFLRAEARDPTMSEIAQFLHEFWVARWAIAQGIGTTVLISVLAIVLGTLLGIFVGLALVYGRWASRFLVRIYVDFVRGTPVLVLVLASYYLLTQIGIHLTAFQAGLVALVIFCSTHVGENLRGALQSLPRGQTEAAKAIGLT